MSGRVMLIILLAAAFAIFLLWNERIGQDMTEAVTLDSVPGNGQEQIEPLHPLPPAPETVSPPPVPGPDQVHETDPPPIFEADPLPLLEQSDDYLLEILNKQFGGDRVTEWLVGERLAERLVVFVNSLDRLPVPVEMRPIVPVPGGPLIDAAGPEIRWSERNFRRYHPLVGMLESIGATEAASLYIRHYPLLQEAHSALATDTRYFNDRLIEIIDHLLATEDVPRPGFAVEAYEALYRLANEEKEAASAGQKILWRIGPEHSERVRSWLQRFRVEIASD
jgi:hypothetical protein